MKTKNLIAFSVLTSLLSINSLTVLGIENTQKPNTRFKLHTGIEKPAKNKKVIAPVVKSKKQPSVNYKVEYINQKWWDKFNDPILTAYILEAADSNHDIKINALKVKESKEMVKEAFGKELPSLSLNANYTRQRFSGNLPMGGFSSPSYTQNNINLPLNVNYELDIWGKNHTYTKKAKKQLEAVKYEEKSAFISLTSLVASVYFNAINIDKQLQIQKDLVSTRKEIFDLMTINYEYGRSTATEVTLADKAYTEALSDLDTLEKTQNTLLNQLSVLIGSSSTESLKLKRGSIEKINLLNDLPKDIPSEIIDQRPDILKSEAEMQAAVLDVKLARRNFLPSINLTGLSGFNAYNMSSLFNWQSYVMASGAGLAQQIFTGGQMVAKLRAKKYRYEQMLENYQKTLLTSVQEINDSLVAVKFDRRKNDNNLKRVEFVKSQYTDISYKYEKGAISYLDTLQYKENLLVLEKEQNQSKTECLIDSLSLYKSVGGKL